MKQNIKLQSFLKYLFLFHFGGGTYTTIELLFRNETYIQMYILGGLCFIICGLLNNWFSWKLELIWQALAGTIIITLLEFATGMIFNVWLNMNMWDYSMMPGNIYGQICPQFILVWLLLALVAIILDDVIRYFFFDEKAPIYYVCGKEIKFFC